MTSLAIQDLSSYGNSVISRCNDVITPAHAAFLKSNASLLARFMNEMVDPCFDENVERAAVWFNASGRCYRFSINPHFWAKIGFLRQCFVISHEILHVLLRHFEREAAFLALIVSEGYSPLALTSNVMNILEDIEINEALVSSAYGFDRSLMTFDGGICFVDTVFPEYVLDLEQIPLNESFEYYARIWLKYAPELNVDDILHLLLESHRALPVTGAAPGQSNRGDDEFDGQPPVHDAAPEMSWEDAVAERDAINTFLGDEVTKEQLLNNEVPVSSSGHGTGSSGNYTIVLEKTRSLDDVFDLSIKTVSKRAGASERSPTWNRPDLRLYSGMRKTNPGASIPGVRKTPKKKKVQKQVLVYMDTSASCFEYIKKMMSLIKNMPEDEYILETYIFAGHVGAIDLESPRFFSGGTEIDQVYEHAQARMAEKTYHGVFVLTDGEFESCHADYQLNYGEWHWFLVPTYDTSALPVASSVMRVTQEVTENEHADEWDYDDEY